MRTSHQQFLLGLCFTTLLTLATGCCSTAMHPIPAQQIPCELLAPAQSGKVPIDFTMLQQQVPQEHIVGSGDILGIYIQNVLGPKEEPGPIHFPDFRSPRYPGQVVSPTVGQPVPVNSHGDVVLPLVKPIPVAGLTLTEASEKIRSVYFDEGILQKGKELVMVGIVKARFARVTVIRDDADAVVPTQVRKESLIYTNRGSGEVLEMPAYENDVLHALVATGGLPGVEAHNHVWVLRAGGNANFSTMTNSLKNGSVPDEAVLHGNGIKFIKIPLKLCPCEAVPFTEQDIVLYDGDIVYVEGRRDEYFYVGGLLSGGQIPMPRDRDIDILDAIAMATGNVNGPAGSNAASTNFRSGPGNIIPPTRAIVVRQMPEGQQIQIEVNVRKALHNSRERILVQPEDLILLKYTASELAGNVALNFVNFNFAIPNGQ